MARLRATPTTTPSTAPASPTLIEAHVVGPLVVQTNIFKPGFRIAFDTTLTQIHARVATPSTGENIVLTVAINGTTSSDTTLTIPATQTSASHTLSAPISLVAGDIVTVNITQVGSGNPGAFLAVQLVME